MWQLVTDGYPIVLTAICGYIVWLLKETKKESDKKEEIARKQLEANQLGTKCLLRQTLIDYHDKYTERGSITPHGYENLCEMIDAYEGLGGNGKVRKMSEETKALPIKER